MSRNYKWCIVRACQNTSIKTPKKQFISVPKNAEIRNKWLLLASRKPDNIALNSVIFFCEDHFDMEKDIANYRQAQMGFSRKTILVDGALPSKLLGQQDSSKRRFEDNTSQPALVKPQKTKIILECEDVQPTATEQEVTNITPNKAIESQDTIEDSRHQSIAPRSQQGRTAMELRTDKSFGMSDIAISEKASAESEKPVVDTDDVQFPPFPEPTDDDFDEGVSEEEKAHYKSKFSDLNSIVSLKLHCTACDRHLGCSAMNESRMRVHPMLKTLVCHTCHAFYNSGEFDKGEDGSELYCRWCGQGGQVYCCAECVHVFCAKCIRRNLGQSKIKEIENTDDWKCFNCNPKCLWDIRAVCWALLRYCDIKNKIVYKTEDPELREKLGKASALDLTECCKNKGRRKGQTDSAKKKEKEAETMAKKIISKMPPTIQVKKFASVNLDEKPKIDKKAVKRSASPKLKNTVLMKAPITISPCPISGPGPKRFKMPTPGLYSPIRFSTEKKISTLTRLPKPRIITNQFNGFNSPNLYNSLTMNNMNNMNMNNMNINNMNMNNMNMSLTNDNINLSLDSLTQGLDFAAVQAMNNSSLNDNNDDLVCTPDFIMEPLCEVTEDNDDDVQCITPSPMTVPKLRNPPPLVPRGSNTPHTALPKNVIQMTESDVSVNALTGGLKFRVDPQTLSSNKMYRLPDGRIFAINSNPNMPGGYSATIVSQNPDGTPKVTPRSETFAAKLSAVASTSSPKPARNVRRPKQKRKVPQKPVANKDTTRECDFKVPVEWFRYNMIDAVDALEYSLSRLHKLKKETTSAHLRTRTVDEMKYLHRTLEQLLTTSSKRFIEIRDTLNKEMKMYISHKDNTEITDEEEDDDVEILPNAENDDPIFIDENSSDSVNGQEVDLTGVASSEHNDSADKTDSEQVTLNQEIETNNDTTDNPADDFDPSMLLDVSMSDADKSKKDDNEDSVNAREELLSNKDDDKIDDEATEPSTGDQSGAKTNKLNGVKTDDEKTDDEETTKSDKGDEKADQNPTDKVDESDVNQTDASDEKESTTDDIQNNDENNDENNKIESNEEFPEKKADFEHGKDQDADMSDEMIETLLKDDNLEENANMELSDLQEAEEILS